MTTHAQPPPNRDLLSEWTEYVGIEHAPRVAAWARWCGEALGAERVVVSGSSLRSKRWRDVDLYPVLSGDRYEQLCPAGLPGGGPGGTPWHLLSSALSCHASAMAGVRVEVHLIREDQYVQPVYQTLELWRTANPTPKPAAATS